MDWQDALLLLFGSFAVLALIGLPVAFAFMAVNIAGLFFLLGEGALSLLAGSAYSSIAHFSLISLPLFILMGEFLLRSGLAASTVQAADAWIGRVPGRLALTAVSSGTIFGTTSGASMATVALLGSTLSPEMERQRYRPAMSVAPILASGGLAVLIPPSGLAVLLGSLAQVSIGKLLLAGLLPGLVLATFYAVYFVGRASLQPQLAPPYDPPPVALGRRLLSLLHLVPIAGLVMVVTGFIFLGVATPSEAAALGALAAALLAAAYGKLSWQVIREATVSTMQTTSMMLLIIVGSTAYSQLLAASGATYGLLSAIEAMELSPLALLILIQLTVLIMGCFIDTISIMLMTVPIFMPIVQSFGMDPIWVCLLILIQLELAGITPPFGVLLFVLKGTQSHIPIGAIYRATWPIVIIQLVVAGLVMAVPGLTSWLPALMASN